MKKLLSVNMAACAFLFLAIMAGLALHAVAADITDQQILAERAQLTLSEFRKAPEMGWFRKALKDAKGVLIVPNLVKGGLLLGGSGGKGVYLARDERTGVWKGPVFYNLGSVTFGLQIGVEASQVIILAMTDDAVNAMLSPQFKLGADASVAAGPIGEGASGNVSLPIAAFISFARSKGGYAGLTLEGAVVKPDDEANTAYYGKYVTPEDILLAGDVSTPKAAELREAVERAVKCPNC